MATTQTDDRGGEANVKTEKQAPSKKGFEESRSFLAAERKSDRRDLQRTSRDTGKGTVCNRFVRAGLP